MEKMLSGRGAFRNGASRLVAAMSVLFALLFSGTALSQEIAISGTVSAPTGAPLREVLVRVQGTDTRTLTDAGGRYALRAPGDAVLNFSLLGRRATQEQVAGRTTINVVMEQVPYLEEVVVTSYVEQRRADITGAVASVDLEAANRQTSASVLQRLDATAPGVTVVASGSPGSRSTVRVRGISSFQNNDPLYIVDGVPVQDSYMNFLNPNDITSIQVLKDASASSIYGARANNGVIVIETTKKGAGGPPQVTLRARAGVASPVRGYDDFLITNALDYHAVLKASYLNAGEPVPTNIYGDPNAPTVPAFIWPNACGALPQPAACRNVVTAFDAFGRPTAINSSAYSFPNTLIMPGSAGTNWWDAVFGSAPVEDYNMDVSGGSDANAYRVSFNYFHQGGTARWNDFKRGSVRVNTQFNRGKFNFGENLAVAVNRHHGGMPGDPDDYVEDGILGKNILMQPVIPVYDINGNFAGGKATGLGNQSNPLKAAWAAKDDENKTDQMFGNVFAGVDVLPNLTLRTSLGFNLSQVSVLTFTPSFPEVAEATFSSAQAENTNRFTDWTLSNTLRYSKVFFDQHTVNVLLGQEANASNNRYIEGSIGSLHQHRRRFPVHPGRPRRRQERAQHRWSQRAVVLLRKGRLQLQRPVCRELYSATRRFVAVGARTPLGDLPGVRARVENHQRVVPVEQPDPLRRHAAVWMGRHRKPVHTSGAHRRSVRRRPWQLLLRRQRGEQHHCRRIPAGIAREPGPEVGGKQIHEHRGRSWCCWTACSTWSSMCTHGRRTTCCSIRDSRPRQATPIPRSSTSGR